MTATDAEALVRLKSATSALLFNTTPDSRAHLIAMQAMLDALAAERDALARDAARYRYLRLRTYKDGGNLCCEVRNGYDNFGNGPEYLDAAIDAETAALARQEAR
jgi:hypothetical protein